LHATLILDVANRAQPQALLVLGSFEYDDEDEEEKTNDPICAHGAHPTK
jgi:hypothetical protein